MWKPDPSPKSVSPNNLTQRHLSTFQLHRLLLNPLPDSTQLTFPFFTVRVFLFRKVLSTNICYFHIQYSLFQFCPHSFATSSSYTHKWMMFTKFYTHKTAWAYLNKCVRLVSEMSGFSIFETQSVRTTVWFRHIMLPNLTSLYIAQYTVTTELLKIQFFLGVKFCLWVGNSDVFLIF